jgi:hypothetical protein
MDKKEIFFQHTGENMDKSGFLDQLKETISQDPDLSDYYKFDYLRNFAYVDMSTEPWMFNYIIWQNFPT